MKTFFRSLILVALLGLGIRGSAAETGVPVAPLPDLVSLRAKLARTKDPLTWVITGDSITHGAKWLGRERSYPEIIQERVRTELNRRRDFFINSAISGERTPGLLGDFDWRVLRFKPDVVSIMIGMNDAREDMTTPEKFVANVREMIGKVRAAGAIPILHRTNPIDSEKESTKTRLAKLPLVNEIIAKVAKSEQVILVDHWTFWQEARPDLPQLREWLADPIHPNGAGHRQFAILFFKAIGVYDPASFTCQP